MLIDALPIPTAIYAPQGGWLEANELFRAPWARLARPQDGKADENPEACLAHERWNGSGYPQGRANYRMYIPWLEQSGVHGESRLGDSL